MAPSAEEFERTALPHSRGLYRVARRLTAETAGAEDLVQETLLSAWRNFRQFQPGTDMRAWLFRILFNCFYASGRRKRAAPQMAPVSEGADGWLESTAPFSLFEHIDVTRAFEALPVEQRTVLLLGVVEGFTCKEMAEILALPIGTVMSRLSRGRDALRLQLTRTERAFHEF